jgi:hypothetical protein
MLITVTWLAFIMLSGGFKITGTKVPLTWS